MIKIFIVIFFVATLFLAVNSEERRSREFNNTSVHTPTFIQKGGSIIVNTDGKTCLLADDALAYEPYISQDATMIAIETQLMSNLQIIRLYKKNEKECSQKLDEPLSTKLWSTLSQQKGFSINDVSRPSMQFMKWIGTDQILIALRGEVNGKSLDENISYIYKSTEK